MCSFSGYLWRWLSSFSSRLTLVNPTDGTINQILCLSTSHPWLKAVTSKRLLAPVLPIWYTCVRRYIIKRVRVSVLYNFYTFSLIGGSGGGGGARRAPPHLPGILVFDDILGHIAVADPGFSKWGGTVLSQMGGRTSCFQVKSAWNWKK